MSDLLSEFLYLYQRMDWISILDIFLVTGVFFVILIMVQDTQAVVLLRGVFLILIFFTLLTSLINLPAFSWLVRTSMPALLLAIPVIFAPEIRRGLERLGRAGSNTIPFRRMASANRSMQLVISAVVTAATRLSGHGHGALIVFQRNDSLAEYIQTGIPLNAGVTPELLMQIFYPNTPLHDGAVIISDFHITAASCVMPLSASGILNSTPDRKMGLRHRASLGISEATDAIAVVVSEETGAISITHNGKFIRNLDAPRLENLLWAFYRPAQFRGGIFEIISNRIRSSRSALREK